MKKSIWKKLTTEYGNATIMLNGKVSISCDCCGKLHDEDSGIKFNLVGHDSFCIGKISLCEECSEIYLDEFNEFIDKMWGARK